MVVWIRYSLGGINNHACEVTKMTAERMMRYKNIDHPARVLNMTSSEEPSDVK